jgi:carboxyl-terminal processing protease
LRRRPPRPAPSTDAFVDPSGHGLGELIGQRTEGAVLAATASLIGDDGLLLLAVEDVLVDGQRLEGVGVAPTIEVSFDSRYAAGGDPQLDRAVQALAGA